MEVGGQPFVCGTCGKRFAEAGDCDRCGDPLLDVRNEEVRQMLIDDDARRASVSFKRWLVLTAPLAIAVVVLGAIYVPGISALLSLVPFGLGYAFAIGGLAVLLTSLAQRIRPPVRLFTWLY